MEGHRLCSRPACQETAGATLTYVYADSTAVLGPLATFPEPHCYDLCLRHAHRLTVPSGWSLIRGSIPEVLEPVDELNALVDAVREPKAAQIQNPAQPVMPREARGPRLDARVRLAVLPSDAATDQESD